MTGVLGNFTDTLTQIAVKAVLKKTLFNQTQFIGQGSPTTAQEVALTAVGGDTLLSYRSAIARQLSSDSLETATTLAQTLVERFAQTCQDSPSPAAMPLGAIADDWICQVQDSGWMTCTLSDPGIATWLAHLSELTVPPPPPAAAAPPWPESWPQWPLCAQLHLSLPMVLHFEHARCAAWIRQGTVAPPWGWTRQSPPPCHDLLRAIAHALDTMADQQGEPKTCLRQGYLLAEAVYAFQAALPYATLSTYSAPVQSTIWTLLRAAQHCLAGVISGVLGQVPAEHL